MWEAALWDQGHTNPASESEPELAQDSSQSADDEPLHIRDGGQQAVFRFPFWSNTTAADFAD